MAGFSEYSVKKGYSTFSAGRAGLIPGMDLPRTKSV